jgi:hypothetical protein
MDDKLLKVRIGIKFLVKLEEMLLTNIIIIIASLLGGNNEENTPYCVG